ncbi:response regulator [Aliirhizobium cellulosilyticum]|uniref:response regulator n=1 Tax=Aliirhizobium cellulosilyticum TaxID=393664 RepID=UPI001608EB39
MTEIPTSSPSRNVLFADPCATADAPIAQGLRLEGCHVILARTLVMAERYAKLDRLDYAVVELRFDEGIGFDLIKSIRDRYPNCRTVVHTSFCNIQTAVLAVKNGAADLYPKPMDVNLVIAMLLQKCTQTTSELQELQRPSDLRDEYIRQTFQSCGSNLTRTATHLSLQRRTLQRIMSRRPELRTVSERSS